MTKIWTSIPVSLRYLIVMHSMTGYSPPPFTAPELSFSNTITISLSYLKSFWCFWECFKRKPKIWSARTGCSSADLAAPSPSCHICSQSTDSQTSVIHTPPAYSPMMAHSIIFYKPSTDFTQVNLFSFKAMSLNQFLMYYLQFY